MSIQIMSMPMLSGDLESGMVETNPWFLEGLNTQDYILAKELGIIDDPNDLDDFDKMIEFEEEFNDEHQSFEDEKHFLEGEYYTKCEFIEKNKTYENIEVRIVKKWNTWALGSIDGNKCVYIPNSLSRNVSIGELSSMSIVFTGLKPNPWKAIHVNKKIEPVEIEEVSCIHEKISEYIKMKTFHIPKQDIGKMVGKNGQNINKIMKDFIYNNPMSSELFDDNQYDGSNEWLTNATDIPKFNITNRGEYSVVNMWYNKFLENRCIEFDPINDLFKKMYV